MQSYLYNDDPSYSDDERYDEDNEDVSSSNINGSTFTYPSYEDDEDMM